MPPWAGALGRAGAGVALLVVALVLLAPSRAAAAGLAPSPWDVEVFQTTSDLHQRLARAPELFLTAGRTPRGMEVIHVADGTRYQRVVGVGGAMTDSSAWLIHNELSPGTRASLLRNLFSAGGIHLNFLRLPMAASDFTVHGKPYSYDDLRAGASDPTLAHFSVVHDDSYIVPSLRQVRSINPGVEIIANPWSAPPWMKANDSFNDLGGGGTLLSSSYGPFAQYFVKFVQAYARRGVPIAGVAPENEPFAAASYPSMRLPEPAEASFIVDNLAPALRAAHLRTRIYGAETAYSSAPYPAALIAGPARTAIGGITQHCYSGTPDELAALHLADPRLDYVVSECANELTPFPVPEVVIGALRDWASAVALWNLALDPKGGPVQAPNSGCRPCGGIVTVDERRHTVTYKLPYYQLGQVGRFVAPGAHRVASEHFVSYFANGSSYGVTSGLDDVAFVNPDGSRVLVAYNNSGRTISFAMSWRRRAVTYRLPAHATATLVWNRRG